MSESNRRRRRRSSSSSSSGSGSKSHHSSSRHSSSSTRSHSSGSSPHSSGAAIRRPPVDAASLWLIIAGIYWMMLVMAMHFPGYAIPPELRLSDSEDDVAHCIAYVGFSFLLCRAFDAMHRRRFPAVNPPVLVYFIIFLVCITYGYIDEETQPLTGRTADAADWEADVLGSVIGCCLHLFVSIFLKTDPAQMVVDRMRRRHSGSSRRRRKHRSSGGSSSGGTSSGEHRGSSHDPDRERGDGHRSGRRRSRREERPEEPKDEAE